MTHGRVDVVNKSAKTSDQSRRSACKSALSILRFFPLSIPSRAAAHALGNSSPLDRAHTVWDMAKNCDNCNAAPAAWFCNSDGKRKPAGERKRGMKKRLPRRPLLSRKTFPLPPAALTPNLLNLNRRLPVHHVRHLYSQREQGTWRIEARGTRTRRVPGGSHSRSTQTLGKSALLPRKHWGTAEQSPFFANFLFLHRILTNANPPPSTQNQLAMRHERVSISVKLELDGACQPCAPGNGGYVQSQERRSVNHGVDASSMDWLTDGGHDFAGHQNAGHPHDEFAAGHPHDDPLVSLLQLEREGQGNNSDFGTFGDDLDLFSSPGAANPSGLFPPSRRDGDGDPDFGHPGGWHEAYAPGGTHHETHTGGGANSSGNSGTSDCTGARVGGGGGGSDKAQTTRCEASKENSSLRETETTLQRPFATSVLRQQQLQRYRAKRLARNLGHKKIRYECRKTLADNRPRVKGRFAKVLLGGIASVSCPDLQSLGKRLKSEQDDVPYPLDSGESTEDVVVPKGRRSRLSGGSDANSGASQKSTLGGWVGKDGGAQRRDSDGSEQMSPTDDGLERLRHPGNRCGLPYTQSEVCLTQLDRDSFCMSKQSEDAVFGRAVGMGAERR